MGPYNNNKGKAGPNRLFGQTMRKPSMSSATRYQRQFGQQNKTQQQYQADLSKVDTTKADEAAARRRLRREQGEIIDAKFGYHRLEDQYQERKKNSSFRTGNEYGGRDETLTKRRGWLFNMAATTVSLIMGSVLKSSRHLDTRG